MNNNEIIYSKHVEKRIEERQLDKQWIEDTILNPDLIIEKAENEIHYFKKFIKFANKILKVVFNPVKKMVITAHFDEKMTKLNKR
jgi:hypothetical protein